jgi:hypothetical protein
VNWTLDADLTPDPPSGVRVHRSRNAGSRVDELHWPWRTRVGETTVDLAETGTVDDVTALLGRAFQRGATTEVTLRALLHGRSRAFWRDVAERPCELTAELGEVLQTRGWDGAPHSCRRLGCAVGG